jgi:hypothetical protein
LFKVRILLDKDARGVAALGFSASGGHLAVVTLDNQHTVVVYDWRRRRVLSTGKGQMGDPPQVCGQEAFCCSWLAVLLRSPACKSVALLSNLHFIILPRRLSCIDNVNAAGVVNPAFDVSCCL